MLVKAQSEFSEDELLSVVLMKLDEDRIITGSENEIINLVGILPNRVIQPIAEHSEYPIECLGNVVSSSFVVFNVAGSVYVWNLMVAVIKYNGSSIMHKLSDVVLKLLNAHEKKGET
ncbi:hypothetical protein VNO77_14285 [Canavalia gladiata]|uniref:Uncharacterized protein n=1 Tax=Canavalia gladiata TaxID=3824 RepID=A0AAN9LYR2_CANGL